MAAMAMFVNALNEAGGGQEDEQTRLAQVERLELALAGAFGPALNHPHLQPALILRRSLLETGGSFSDALALADAVKDDIAGKPLADESALLDHAARSAAPVLRYLLHLHGECRDRVMAQADELARAWFLLLHLPGRKEDWRQRKRSFLDDIREAAKLLSALLERARALPEEVADGRVKKQLCRLLVWGEEISDRLASGRADADGPLLSPSPLVHGRRWWRIMRCATR